MYNTKRVRLDQHRQWFTLACWTFFIAHYPTMPMGYVKLAFGPLGSRFQRPWVRILHSAIEDNWSPFDSISFPYCQCININTNKHVYRQSQGKAISTMGSSVWILAFIVIGTGHPVEVFSLMLYSSVGLSAGIQSAGDSVRDTLHSAEEDDRSPFDLISLPCCQCIKSYTTKT